MYVKDFTLYTVQVLSVQIDRPLRLWYTLGQLKRNNKSNYIWNIFSKIRNLKCHNFIFVILPQNNRFEFSNCTHKSNWLFVLKAFRNFRTNENRIFSKNLTDKCTLYTDSTYQLTLYLKKVGSIKRRRK